MLFHQRFDVHGPFHLLLSFRHLDRALRFTFGQTFSADEGAPQRPCSAARPFFIYVWI